MQSCYICIKALRKTEDLKEILILKFAGDFSELQQKNYFLRQLRTKLMKMKQNSTGRETLISVFVQFLTASSKIFF